MLKLPLLSYLLLVVAGTLREANTGSPIRQTDPSPPSTVIRGMLRPPDAEGSRHAEEVRGRTGNRGARASTEADPGWRGSGTHAQPRSRPFEGRAGRTRWRGSHAHRPGDRAHAADLLGHRGSGA